jgi:hypothetical protein
MEMPVCQNAKTPFFGKERRFSAKHSLCQNHFLSFVENKSLRHLSNPLQQKSSDGFSAAAKTYFDVLAGYRWLVLSFLGANWLPTGSAKNPFLKGFWRQTAPQGTRHLDSANFSSSEPNDL